jgi:hypothetical protein
VDLKASHDYCPTFQVLTNNAYHLQSPRKPIFHCLPFATTINSHYYCLSSTTISCTLSISTFKYSIFLEPYTNYYFLVVASNFLFQKLQILYRFLPLFVEETYKYYATCSNTLCKLKLYYLPHFSIE